MDECHQQGLGRSITGLWVGKATSEIATGAWSSSQGVLLFGGSSVGQHFPIPHVHSGWRKATKGFGVKY